VREEFERNFSERGELGASVSIMLDGEPVVDLWGGHADDDAGSVWERDTLVVVFSTTKGMTALAAHMLADRGVLDFDAPVVRYWPEFGEAGKEAIPVRMLLNHQAGLAAWREPLPDGALYDWELVTDLLARQAPWWEPGTRVGYHAVTFGHLVGEVVRRVAGRSVGTFLREEIAGPLDADVYIGLAEELEPRVAPTALYDYSSATESEFAALVLADPEGLPAKLQLNTGGWLGNQEVLDTRASHAAEIPAANGIANARGLARMYAPLALGGAIDGVRLVRPDAITGMRYVQSRTERDASALVATAFSLGFLKSWDNRALGEGMSTIIGECAFGHAGLGGSIGFADPVARMSFGYTMNRHGHGTGINARGQSLVDAAYRAVGALTDAPGYWVLD
jgi:CubicO group peptidase (beta-lactamase class C family)